MKLKFKTKAKYRTIRREHRLSWLKSKIAIAMKRRGTSIESLAEYRNMRRAFSQNAPQLADNQQCFICESIATIRHHITPLILGGTNKVNNIVPLCNGCHEAVHMAGPRVKAIPIPDDDPGVVHIRTLLRTMYDSH